MFSNQQIADYYNTTKVHYDRGWDLRYSLAMHYGYWDEKTKNFRSSLNRMNEALASFGGIQSGAVVLDAGCGVGGSSIFLAKELGCKVTGISLSEQQVESARNNAKAKRVELSTRFEKADFRSTPFEAASFDVVWALESAVYDAEKHDFLQEVFRLLKPGGRLILGEYIKTPQVMRPREKKIFYKWLNAWAITDLSTLDHLKAVATARGFQQVEIKNVTPQIRKSSWRMFYGSFFLTVLSTLYRWYNPRVSPFADKHYLGLRYQYSSLRQQLWAYYFICMTK
ncbi:MAG: methyltransferase domain-containing protein [Saprospiraceae bacterium]